MGANECAPGGGGTTNYDWGQGRGGGAPEAWCGVDPFCGGLTLLDSPLAQPGGSWVNSTYVGSGNFLIRTPNEIDPQTGQRRLTMNCIGASTSNMTCTWDAFSARYVINGDRPYYRRGGLANDIPLENDFINCRDGCERNWSNAAGAGNAAGWFTVGVIGAQFTAAAWMEVPIMIGWRGGEATLTRLSAQGADKFFRLNPFGDWKNTNPLSRRPHYHRRPGIKKHRPWEGW